MAEVIRRIRGAGEFYATVAVPLLYGVNLWLVAEKGNLEIGFYFKVIALFLVLIGVVLWSVSFFNLGKSFGVLPRKQERIKKGLYKWFRHPMYWGILLTFLGIGLVNGTEKGISFTILVMAPILWWRAILEDGKLV